MVSPFSGVGYLTGMRIFSRGREGDPPIVIAHRGASCRALENSLAAFSLSLTDGADMIEFDVRLSADGEPVVIHDQKTGRSARENVTVARCDAARIRKIDPSHPPKLAGLSKRSGRASWGNSYSRDHVMLR